MNFFVKVVITPDENEKYLSIGAPSADAARRVAFRHVFRRPEEDHSELMNRTHVLIVTTVSSDMAKWLLEMNSNTKSA